MQQIEIFINKNPTKVFFILILLAIPCFLINLGLMPLLADESTRANVALEMILTNNFAVPTIGGEYYYNKPPLYNWILSGFYMFTGSYSELVTRLPALIPLFLFAVTIYYSVVYFIKDKRVAVLSGLLLLVNGRVLIYDSMLGHIDIFYSWLTFGSFMLIFYFYKRKQWFWLFFVSYLITAITFLCKGLPSIVFQGFTILALLIYSKNLKKLVSWQHLLCGTMCLLIIGLYFFNYYQYNPNLKGYLETIWDQSSQRTVSNEGFGSTIIYILQFPFEHLGHLFPASLLLLFCFHKGFWKGLMQNEFLKYITIVFLVNIVVYWMSPQTRPRYVLMLYPLVFIAWSYNYYTYREKLPKLNRLFDIIIFVLAAIVTLAIPALLFTDFNSIVDYFLLKVIIVLVGCTIFTVLIYKLKGQKIIAFIGFLIIAKLGFSWFVLPYRAENSLTEINSRKAAIEMGKISKKNPFYFYQYHPDVLSIPFHDQLIFYIQRTRMKQVKFTESNAKPGYYFTFDRDLNAPNAQLIKIYQGNLKLYLLK